MSPTSFSLLIAALLPLISPPNQGAPVELRGRCSLVSLDHLDLKSNDRVSGFRLNAVSGWIESIPHIPQDWNVEVDNSSGYQATLSGVATHGVGALADASFFRHFVTVEWYPPLRGVSLPEPNIEIEVYVSEMPDLNNQVRTIKLKMKDLVLEESQDRGEGNLQPRPRERR